LERLARYGPDLEKGARFLEAALLAGDVEEAAHVMRDMTYQVLLPIYGLLQECDKEIPLEEVGAEKLRDIWPIERLGGMYAYLQDEPILPPEAVDMIQGIEVICTALNNPTPFQDPLVSKRVPIAGSGLNITSETGASTTSTSLSEDLSIPSGASALAESGFSNPLVAPAAPIIPEKQADSACTGSGFVKLLAATAEKAENSQQAKSDDTPNPTLHVTPSSTKDPPLESSARTAVLEYIATDNMYFESEVQDLIRNKTVAGIHRRQAAECLKQLVRLANGEQGFLGDMDAGHYRTQIETCVIKIDALPTGARLIRDTQALKKLCGTALKLWSVHAK
jgi:hypothetical protein